MYNSSASHVSDYTSTMYNYALNGSIADYYGQYNLLENFRKDINVNVDANSIKCGGSVEAKNIAVKSLAKTECLDTRSSDYTPSSLCNRPFSIPIDSLNGKCYPR